jgi:hypothetical protein
VSGTACYEPPSFIETGQLTAGLRASKNIPGFIHPDHVARSFPALADWAAKWTRTLGRKVSVGGFVLYWFGVNETELAERYVDSQSQGRRRSTLAAA